MTFLKKIGHNQYKNFQTKFIDTGNFVRNSTIFLYNEWYKVFKYIDRVHKWYNIIV